MKTHWIQSASSTQKRQEGPIKHSGEKGFGWRRIQWKAAQKDCADFRRRMIEDDLKKLFGVSE